MNKYIKYILPVILVSIILYGYFKIKSYDIGKTDPAFAVTDKNIFFIEAPDIFSLMNDFMDEESIWSELKVIPEINKTDSLINSLLSLSKKEAKIKNLLSGKMLLSININPDNSLSSVIISQQITRGQSNSLYSFLQNMQGIENVSKKRFEGNFIYEVVPHKKSGIRPFYYAFKKGLFVSSFSMHQIEETLMTLNTSENLNTVKSYHKNQYAISNFKSTILNFNFQTFNNLINRIFNQETLNTSFFAESAEFDINIRKNGLSFNGFITANDSVDEGIGIIAGQKPDISELIKAVPGSVASFLLMNITDLSAFVNLQSKFSIWKPNQKRLVEIENKYSISFQNFIKDNFRNEFGLIILENRNKPSFFFIAEVNSGSMAETQLKEFLEKWASINGKKPEDNYFYKEIDNQSKLQIYNLPLGGIPEIVFGKLLSEVKNDFFTIYDNYLIFGNSSEEIGNYVYQLMLGRNFTESEKYKSILENILSRTNLFVYADLLKMSGIFTDKINPKFLEFYNNTEVLKKFNAFSFQSNYSDGLFYSRIFMNYSDVINDHVNTVWQSKLDTLIITKPAIVTNHLNSGKEIMVQDANNQLYLISNAGRILWKIPLDGSIMSEIYQIDYYRNKKLQYIFNTKNKIYIIDRNGNPVDKYPQALRSPATNGIALFDYEKDGNLRICIACENKHIYMYNIEGKVIPGWSPAPTDRIITQPVQHFRISGKDYLVAADINKTYIYDRRGKIRVNLSKQYTISPNNPFYLDTSQGMEKARLINTDTLGNFIYIYLTGNTILEKSDPEKHNPFFILSDLNGDNENEYIKVCDTTLIVYDKYGKIIFNVYFNSNIKFKPIIFEFAKNNKKIGIILDMEENIYLFNNDGSVYKGFPLKGTTLFSISSFPDLKGRFNLIVGNNDNFLYNYSVQ